MKSRRFIGGLIGLIIGAVCQSTHYASAVPPGPTRTNQPAYIVKLIPTHQLTPTSREGDKANVVYSRNIVAVYLNTNGISAGMTNAPTARSGKTATPRQ